MKQNKKLFDFPGEFCNLIAENESEIRSVEYNKIQRGLLYIFIASWLNVCHFSTHKYIDKHTCMVEIFGMISLLYTLKKQYINYL